MKKINLLLQLSPSTVLFDFQKFSYLHHRRVLPPWDIVMLSNLSHDPPRCPVAYVCHFLDVGYKRVRISVFVWITHGLFLNSGAKVLLLSDPHNTKNRFEISNVCACVCASRVRVSCR